jgi:integrase
MPRLTQQNPSNRKHKASGRAVVTLDGTDIYLGPYGTAASRKEYDRVIGEWLAAGRRLPARDGAGMSIAELIESYRHFAETYYRKPDGSDSGEIKPIKLAMRQLRKLHGKASVSDFGPLALKGVRQGMIDAGRCRTYIKQQVGRIKRLFKWGVENELVAADAYHALQAVTGLKEGRTLARESEPVEPVPDALVEAVRPLVSPQVRAMIDVQLSTGMRPGEVVAMRRADLDTSGDV